MQKIPLIFFIVIFLLPQALSNHYFARARLINRDYEYKKMSSRSVAIRTSNGDNPVLFGEDFLGEKYYFTLSTNAQAYKIVTIRNDTMNNTLLFISTDTYRPNNPDQVYFYPETFKEFYNFLFTNDEEINLQTDDIIYNINKHSASDSYFHLTILMKTPIESTLNDTNEYKMRGLFLTSSEYFNLLSHSSHLLADLGL